MLDLSDLDGVSRLLFTVPLRPIQTDRFQPTGFPNLGAATYQTSDGPKLLVESAQSMANRLEAVCWDEAENKPHAVLDGISHVTVKRNGMFLTDTMLEAHRLNSPYLLEASDKSFINKLKEELGGLAEGPIDRAKLAKIVLKYDVGSLIHGLFLAKGDLAGGRLRIARSLSAFIEASGVQPVPSGGVKNDHVNPSGETKAGFGNVPFARDEFTADSINCYFNVDLSQIRGFGLGPDVDCLLILLCLHRIRRLLDSDMRLRTACDLEPLDRENITASRPAGFRLPGLTDIESDLLGAVEACSSRMVHETVSFNDPLKKAKQAKADSGDGDTTEASED